MLTLKTVGLKFVQKELILETRVQRFHQNTMEEILGFNSIFQQHIMVKAVKPAIVMADGESANPGELALFTTNGTGWQHVGEWLKK